MNSNDRARFERRRIDGAWRTAVFALVAATLVGCAAMPEESQEPGPEVPTVPSTATDEARAPVCGDGRCRNGETCSTCAADCGSCAPAVSCGDRVCNGAETCSTCAADCGSCPVAGTFALVGTHPFASTESTATARELHTLEGFNGRLYAGYGDYSANTGPTTLVPFDPGTRSFGTGFTSLTETIDHFRVINGKIHAPAIDPRGSGSNTFAVGEPWADRTGPTLTHVFDVVTLTGSDLWIVGSGGGSTGCTAPYASSNCRAVVYRSLDGGTTWTLAHAQTPVSGTSGDFSRYYFAGVLNGRFYVQAFDHHGGPHPASRVFDGTSWSNGPNLLPNGTMGWHPVTFAGRMVYRSWAPPYVSYQLFAFDGASVTTLGSNLASYDFTVAGAYLYVLGQDGTVRRTSDLRTFTTVGSAPAGARSLAVLGGRLYVGTTNSQIYEYSQPVQ